MNSHSVPSCLRAFAPVLRAFVPVLETAATAMVLAALTLSAGCQSYSAGSKEWDELHGRASLCIRYGMAYEGVPVVRANSVEAAADVQEDELLPWIRQAVHDEDAIVRFAACMALGRLADEVSRSSLELRLEDADPNVRIAAIYALHNLGDTSHTSELAEDLLESKDDQVRRNAALTLGRLGESGAIKLLNLALRDRHEGVVLQTIESLALLGDEGAKQKLVFNALSGIGYKEALALEALGRMGESRYEPVLGKQLLESRYVESKLVAAAGLGRMGDPSGFNVALSNLRFAGKDSGDQDDPPQRQQTRVRGLAALALGCIGHPAALPELRSLMEANDDPQVQVAAAKAILEIMRRAKGGQREAEAGKGGVG